MSAIYRLFRACLMAQDWTAFPVYPSEASVKSPESSCEHTCQRDCELLNEALRREQQIALFYDSLSNQCDYPDVRRFLSELAAEKTQAAQRISDTVNRMYSSFDPAGC